MYSGIKKILRVFVPKRILFKYEPAIRHIIYQLYRGKKFHCNICNRELRKFIEPADGDKICPNCGSIRRNRRLWEILISELGKKRLTVLDFSPSRSLYRVLKQLPSIHYQSSDLSGDFLSDKAYDITNIDAENEQYDLIICYHILEHVENDQQAMNELFRVLKKNGKCIIQTPFKDGKTYEDPSIVSKKDRIKHFGQSDHIRIYSAYGLREKLEKSGFQVMIRDYLINPDNKYGFSEHEKVLICKK